jgi:hypothetical protein
MQRSLWISFDLGVRGDYEGMYAWLDTHEAIECGDSVAYVKYDYEGDLIESLREDIKNAVEVTKKTRIYVVWQDPVTHSTKGRFVLGSRKAPPWAGYAASTGDEESDSGSDES